MISGKEKKLLQFILWTLLLERFSQQQKEISLDAYMQTVAYSNQLMMDFYSSSIHLSLYVDINFDILFISKYCDG